MYDFEDEMISKYQVTEDREYVRENYPEMKMHKKEESHDRPLCVETNETVEMEWFNVIAERNRNGRVITHDEMRHGGQVRQSD